MRAVVLPSGSWDDALPYAAAFQLRALRICSEFNVSLTDWSSLLDDGDFIDFGHANATGQRKLHDALVEITADHVAGLHFSHHFPRARP